MSANRVGSRSFRRFGVNFCFLRGQWVFCFSRNYCRFGWFRWFLCRCCLGQSLGFGDLGLCRLCSRRGWFVVPCHRRRGLLGPGRPLRRLKHVCLIGCTFSGRWRGLFAAGASCSRRGRLFLARPLGRLVLRWRGMLRPTRAGLVCRFPRRLILFELKLVGEPTCRWLRRLRCSWRSVIFKLKLRGGAPCCGLRRRRGVKFKPI